MSLDIRKSGIPVLAYPHCDAAPTSSCLIFRFNETQATATILLQSSLLIDGHDEPQKCTMQYDADCLKLGSIGPATIPLPQSRLDQLAREGNPQMQTLSLTLKRLAPVWVPLHVKLRPQMGQEAVFERVAVLARATTLHILFDFKWLHRDHQAVFRRLINHPEQLRAFPVWRHYNNLYRRGDWSVFEDGMPEVPDELVGECPPQYAESSKRPRNATPTVASPPHKRVLLSPYDAHPSPTEKDSVATTSPNALSSPASPIPCLPPCHLTPDAQHIHTTERDTATSSALATALFSLPQSSLEVTISSLLPNILSSLLPSLLPRLLTLQSPSPAPSLLDAPSQRGTPPPSLSMLLGTPRASDTVGQPAATPSGQPPTLLSGEEHFPTSAAQPSPPPLLSALGISVSEHVTRRIEFELSSLYSHTLSHANFLRNEADAAFFDDREGERLAWQREVESAIAAFKEQLADIGVEQLEHVEEELEQKGNITTQRVEKAVEEAVARVERLKGEKDVLKGEAKELKEDRRELRKEKKELKRDIKHLRRQKSDLRRDVKYLRRRKGKLQVERGSKSTRSILSAGSAVDSQDLDAT